MSIISVRDMNAIDETEMEKQENKKKKKQTNKDKTTRRDRSYSERVRVCCAFKFQQLLIARTTASTSNFKY